jgi:hypothetical protein
VTNVIIVRTVILVRIDELKFAIGSEHCFPVSRSCIDEATVEVFDDEQRDVLPGNVYPSLHCSS